MLSQTQIRSYWAPRCTGPFATVSLYGLGKVTVDAAIVPAVKALNQVLTAYKYKTRYGDTGAYNCRKAIGSTAWSTHAYAIALDVNWQSNPYSRYLRTDMFLGDGRMPHRICAIRTNNGKQVWNWGGFWSGSKDAMHYEIVCTPADLRTGINWATVYKGTTAAPIPVPKPVPAPTGGLVYRIHWFKSAGKPTAAYRTVSARTEKNGGHLVVEAWHIKDPTELKVWHDRGLVEANRHTSPASPRGSIQFYNGPYDNTKTY